MGAVGVLVSVTQRVSRHQRCAFGDAKSAKFFRRER